MVVTVSQILLVTFIWLVEILGTVDLNMPELEFVANHLEKRDCRRLVTALHDPHFDLLNNMDVAGVNSHSNIVFKLCAPDEDTLEIL